VGAGMEMLAALVPLNEEFSKKGWPHISIGIGINTGPMSVGNMGSEFRQAYTVMGDSVNLGSRLEALTKNYGVGFLVSEFTRWAAPEFFYRELDRVQVKGKAEPVTVYEPLGMKDQLPAQVIDDARLFENALRYYREQKWDEAEKILKELLVIEPDSFLFKLYLERISIFRQDPPGDEWDGVFVYKTK